MHQPAPRPATNRRSFLTLAVGGAVLAGVTAFGLSNRGRRAAVPPAGYFETGGSLDLGEIPLGPPREVALAVTNPTDGPVRFEVETSCNCTAVAPASFELGPGERREIVATLDPWELGSGEGFLRPFAAGVFLKANGGLQGGGQVDLRGEVRAPIRVDEEDLRVEHVSGEERGASLAVRILLQGDAESVAFERADGAVYRTDLAAADPAGTNEYTVVLPVRADLARGTYETPVVVAVAGRGRRADLIELKTVVRSSPPYRLHPDTVYFGAGGDAEVSETVAVEGVAGYEVTVVSAETPGATASASGRSVRVSPPAGPRSGGETEIPITLRGERGDGDGREVKTWRDSIRIVFH